MNSFINPDKRGHELPEGCKDLIDLLPQPDRAARKAEPLVKIHGYLFRLLHSAVERRFLMIHSIERSISIWLFRYKGEFRASISMGAEREQNVRYLLNESDIHLIQDEPMDPGPGMFSRLLTCVLPTDTSGIAQFIPQLLREGYALPEGAELDFSYRE